MRCGVHSRANASGPPTPCCASCSVGDDGGTTPIMTSLPWPAGSLPCPVVSGTDGDRLGRPGRLSRRGRLWRAAVTVAVLGGLAYGTIAGSNKDFPFGPMTQYAFYIAPDGEVDSTTVWADTTAGTRVHVVLGGHGVGIKRAGLENQLRRIIANPSLLRPIAVAQRRLHPNEPQYTRIYVMQTVFPLRDRVPQKPFERTVVTWTVTG